MSRARGGLARLTDEALVDEAVGLHVEARLLRHAIENTTAERDALRAQLQAATTDGQGRVIGQLQRQLRSAQLERDQAMRGARMAAARTNEAVARVRRLEALPISMEGAR